MTDKFLLNLLFDAAQINLTALIDDDGEVYAYDRKANKLLSKQDLFKIAITMTRNMSGRPDCFYSLRNAVVNRAQSLNII